MSQKDKTECVNFHAGSLNVGNSESQFPTFATRDMSVKNSQKSILYVLPAVATACFAFCGHFFQYYLNPLNVVVHCLFDKFLANQIARVEFSFRRGFDATLCQRTVKKGRKKEKIKEKEENKTTHK